MSGSEYQIDYYRKVLPTEWRRKNLADAMIAIGITINEVYLADSVGKTIRLWKSKGLIEQTKRGMTFWQFVKEPQNTEEGVVLQPATEQSMPCRSINECLFLTDPKLCSVKCIRNK